MRKRARLGVLVGAVALATLLVAGLLLIELLIDAPSRAAATRLAAAVVLAIAAYRVRLRLARDASEQPRSTIELAGEPGARRAPDRSRFEQLRDEIRFGARSQRYFDAVLWPHLVSLAETTTGEAAGLEKPPGRRFGRGPSVAALGRVIATIEAPR